MADNNKPVVCPDVMICHDEKEEGLSVSVELPGISKKKIDLSVASGGFCISAERDDLKYDGCYQFAHAVNSDSAKAKFENGLLTFNVPFKEPLCGKKVMIE